jgi:hypothetical protein
LLAAVRIKHEPGLPAAPVAEADAMFLIADSQQQGSPL